MLNKQESFLLMYTTADGVTKVDVRFDEETVWLTQAQMAELFQKAKSTINYHIQQVYEDGELSRDSTMRKFENFEFSTKLLSLYNPDRGVDSHGISYMMTECSFLAIGCSCL